MTELHGGNIYRLAEALGIGENRIIDFSASINPLGVPKSVISAIGEHGKYLFNYPDPDAKKLRLHIARQYKINPEFIICGNGSTELIYLIARALQPKKVLIPEPTFSEYERAILTTSRKSVSFGDPLRREVRSQKLRQENNFDISPEEFIKALSRLTPHASRSNMAFLCNPNNPTGRLLKKKEVLKIAESAKKLKCYLVVDEAFIDFRPEDSVVREVRNNPYLIVLRSLTKFYALSGLRIGYGVLPLNVVDIVNRYKEPWTVNALAQTAGIAALNDTDYKKATFKAIKQEKDFLEKEFERLDINYIPSEANYYLLRLNNAKKAIQILRNAGILVRDCSNFKGLDSSYIRVAVKSNRDNKRLLKELACL